MIKIIVKFIFASAIIIWLFRSGDLDLSLIPKMLNHQYRIATMVAIGIFISFLTAYRWKKLLDSGQQNQLPMKSIFRLTWIGMFFSAVLPGAVTGDLIKLAYAKKINQNASSSYLLSSIFLDRIFGLSGLILVLGFFTALNYTNLISKSTELTTLIHFNIFLLIGTMFFFISIFIHTKVQSFILNLTKKIPLIGSKFANLFEMIWLIGKNKKIVFLAVGISLLVQIMGVLSFFIIVEPFAPSLSLLNTFTFVPIGFITIAIPISPQGLGVGHVVFNTLFSFFKIDNGASLFNLYFLVTLIINLLGSIPYILSTGKTKKQSANS